MEGEIEKKEGWKGEKRDRDVIKSREGMKKEEWKREI